MGSLVKITMPREIKECLCCTVGNPGDDSIFTEYSDVSLTDLKSGILMSELKKGRGKKTRLLLIKARKEGKGKKGRKYRREI